MSTVGREVIGRCDYNMLIADNKHPLDVCHVMISAGAKHKKGEILEVTEDGKCNILGTAALGSVESALADGNAEEPTDETKTEGTGTAVAAYILAEDVDAEAADAIGAAYRSGSFVRNALFVKEGYSLTDKDEKELRNGGIYLSDAIL